MSPSAAALTLLGLGIIAVGPTTAAEPVSNWMVMQVCTDTAGAVLPGVAPTDPACQARRPIHAGETPPYQLSSWPSRMPATRAAGDGCSANLVFKWNVPVEKSGVTRIVSVTAHGDGCSSDGEPETAFKGLSIQWHDAGYGFIMASWSPVAASSFESPLCSQAEGSARRFFRGWVIAPAEVPPARQVGWGVFPSHLTASHDGPPAGACPAHYQSGLTLWVRDTVPFRGATLQAIVSNHFARADAEGVSPGPAEQVERTYWTREFGLTRWEKWSREDWVNPRSGRPAAELAAAVYRHGQCGAPYGLPTALTPGMQAEALRSDGSYSQALVDPRSGERHVWYMTLCSDWTNLVRTPPRDGARQAASGDPAYWRE